MRIFKELLSGIAFIALTGCTSSIPHKATTVAPSKELPPEIVYNTYSQHNWSVSYPADFMVFNKDDSTATKDVFRAKSTINSVGIELVSDTDYDADVDMVSAWIVAVYGITPIKTRWLEHDALYLTGSADGYQVQLWFTIINRQGVTFGCSGDVKDPGVQLLCDDLAYHVTIH